MGGYGQVKSFCLSSLEGVEQSEPSPGRQGVGRGCSQLLPGADLVGVLLSQTQPARDSICR